MSISQNDVIRTAAKALGPQGQQIVNVFYHQCVAGEYPAIEADIMEMIAEYLDDMYTPLEGEMPSTLTADALEFYNVTQEKPLGSLPWPSWEGGTSIGDHLPEGVAACITASTAVKRVLPKKFLGVLMEGDQTAGNWGAGLLTDLALFAAAWIANITSGPYVLQPGTWRRLLEVFVPLTGAVVKSICSYQRRRKPGVGA
jgi:hypothetical protein